MSKIQSNQAQKKPKILVVRAIFPETLARLEEHFDVQSNQSDATWTKADWLNAVQDCEGILSMPADRIDKETLAAAPLLKICANMAVGYNNFDLEEMTARHIKATNTPDVLTETTADFGFALLMATARRITEGEHLLRSGQWQKWRFDMLAGADIHGATLGILGMGRIGQSLAKRGAFGFNMRVIYNNRTPLDLASESACQARYVDKETLLKSSDYLVLTLPYSEQTHHSIGAKELALMKPNAILINIARGGIVDDQALALSLKNKQIAAAGLDVFEGEPAVHPDLLALQNVVLTPHIASASIPTRRAMADLAADNLIHYFSGKGALTPLN